MSCHATPCHAMTGLDWLSGQWTAAAGVPILFSCRCQRHRARLGGLGAEGELALEAVKGALCMALGIPYGLLGIGAWQEWR